MILIINTQDAHFELEDDRNCFVVKEFWFVISTGKDTKWEKVYICKDEWYPSDFNRAIISIYERIKKNNSKSLEAKEYLLELKRINTEYLEVLSKICLLPKG